MSYRGDREIDKQMNFTKMLKTTLSLLPWTEKKNMKVNCNMSELVRSTDKTMQKNAQLCQTKQVCRP